MSVIISSFWSKPLDGLAAMTWTNKESYCYRHGYTPLWKHHQDGADIMWDRPLQWAKVLDEAPDNAWCLFMGCDTLFTRPDIALDAWLDDKFDGIVLVDHNNVFGDVHLWKASPQTYRFMLSIGNRTNPFGMHYPTEQDSLTAALSNNSLQGYRESTGISYGSSDFYANAEKALNKSGLKIKVANGTNLAGDDPAHWPTGDIPLHHAWTKEHLIVHLGGISNERRMRAIPSYLF